MIISSTLRSIIPPRGVLLPDESAPLSEMEPSSLAAAAAAAALNVTWGLLYLVWSLAAPEGTIPPCWSWSCFVRF
jgi:hypothetical protein